MEKYKNCIFAADKKTAQFFYFTTIKKIIKCKV